jgi:pimeloyl-[acyl-carrier protein] methyl ester esterase
MTTLVLLPGMDGTGLLFSAFVDAMGDKVKSKVVCYPTDRCLDYEQLTDIARAAVPSDEPFVLLGESFSGPVAIRLAAEQPDRLHGLVLCCSFASCPRPRLAKLARPLLQWPLPMPPISLLSEVLMGGFSTPHLRMQLEKAVQRVPAAVLRSRLAQVMSVDVSAELMNIRVPLLYLQASRDRLVPSAAEQKIKRLQPNAQLRRLPGPHFLLQCLPQASASTIQGFLDTTEHAS